MSDLTLLRVAGRVLLGVAAAAMAASTSVPHTNGAHLVAGVALVCAAAALWGAGDLTPPRHEEDAR